MQPLNTFWLVILGMILGIFLVLLYANKTRFLNHEHVHYHGGGDIMGGIKTALDHYEIDVGTYPKNFQDLIRQPTGMTNWHGPYLDPPKVPVDSWGHNYIYEFPGKHNTNGYDLSSAGPDGKKGNYDDIGNW